MNNLDAQRQLVQWLCTLEPLLRMGDMAAADKFLDDLVVTEDVHTASLLGVISLTWHAKAHLYRRDAFIERVDPVMIERLGKERAENLLNHRR
jgi:hypothetical protein